MKRFHILLYRECASVVTAVNFASGAGYYEVIYRAASPPMSFGDAMMPITNSVLVTAGFSQHRVRGMANTLFSC